MNKKQSSPELLQAEELLPTQEEQVPANPLSRKRQLESESDDDAAEPRTKRARTTTTRPISEPARLTRKNLALFDKMRKHSQKTSTHRDSDDTTTTKSLSTTASGFDVRAYKNGILDPRDSKPPKNLEDIRKRLAETRATASLPESVYEDYVDKIGEAPNEATVVVQVSGKLLKEYPGKSYKQVFNQAFAGYPKDVGFNNGLSVPQPDFVEGLGMQEYRPFPVDKHVSGAVLYKDDRHSVTLPHIAGEWKGPDGSMPEATLQSSYDGAALVYARNQALAYLQGKSDPPGHASITTFTTNGTHLNFYAHYATETGDGTLEYHQCPVKSTSLINSHGEHKEGRRGLRNAQDHAREQSHALKDRLKEHYKQQQQQRRGTLRPTVETVPPPLPVPDVEPLVPTQTYADEDDVYDVVEPQPVYQPTPPTSSKPKHSRSHHSHSHHHSQHSHHSHSTPHSSKAPSSTHGSTDSSGLKRKASSSQESSSSSSRHKYKSYWKKDAMSGRYYHKHSDGTVSWLDDDVEEEEPD